MGEPILADKLLPKSVPHGDKFWQGRTSFGSKSGPGGPVFLQCQISPAGLILGGIDFDVR